MSIERNNVQTQGPYSDGASLSHSSIERPMFEVKLLKQFQIPKSKQANFDQANFKQANFDQANFDQANFDQANFDQFKINNKPYNSFLKQTNTKQTNTQQTQQLDSESSLDSSVGDSEFTYIRFQIMNRKNFKLRPEDAERSLLPIVLVGNKRRACNFINYLNESSPDYRDLLHLKRGDLIPFKMIDADSFSDFNISSLNGRQIRLLCIYSDVFDQDVEKKIRDNLVRIGDVLDCESDDSSSDNIFIKTVSTIYLRNANSNLKITRVKHRRNDIENNINYFKERFQAYSELPEIGWQDIICLRTEDVQDRYLKERYLKNQDLKNQYKLPVNGSDMSLTSICGICAESVDITDCARYSCGHSSCIKCAGCIVSISRRCPFCRKDLRLSDLILNLVYIPSLFSSIKELLDDIMRYEQNGSQSVIYVPNELAIQHLYNFLIQSIESIEGKLNILIPTFNFSLLLPTERSTHHYFLACSNDLISKLPNINVIITSTDDDHCKNLMLDFKSYGRNYGKADQELIVLNADQ